MGHSRVNCEYAFETESSKFKPSLCCSLVEEIADCAILLVAKVHPPPRVESTQPWDTSPELSSGEETVGESKVGENQFEAPSTSLCTPPGALG